MLHPLALPTLTWPLWVNNLGYREIRLGCLHPTGCVYIYVVCHVRLYTMQPHVRSLENLKQSLSRSKFREQPRGNNTTDDYPYVQRGAATVRIISSQCFVLAVFILLCPRELWWITTKLDATVVAVVAISFYFCREHAIIVIPSFSSLFVQNISSLLNFCSILLFRIKVRKNIFLASIIFDISNDDGKFRMAISVFSNSTNPTWEALVHNYFLRAWDTEIA